MDRETADEIKRHINVVAEGLRSELRAIAEGVAAITGRLDRFEQRLNCLASRMAAEVSAK